MFRPRWLPRRRQLHLADLMLAISGCALILGAMRLPAAFFVAVAVGGSLVACPVLMARWGYKLVDIVVATVLWLLTIAFLCTATAQTRYLSAGKRTFPLLIPPQISSLLHQE